MLRVKNQFIWNRTCQKQLARSYIRREQLKLAEIELAETKEKIKLAGIKLAEIKAGITLGEINEPKPKRELNYKELNY